MKTLVVVGDSHTAGSEIEDSQKVKNNSFCVNRAWGAHLSNKLGYKHINIAQPGGSNWWITRTTKDWVYNNLVKESNYTVHDFSLIVMWSSFHRTEIIYPDSGDHRIIGPSTTIQAGFKSNHNDDLEQYQNLIITFNDPVQNHYENLYHVYNLQQYLEKHNVNYKFVNGIQHFCHPSIMNKNNVFFDSYNSLYEQFDWKDDYIGALNRPETYYFYFKDVEKVKLNPWVKNSHYSEKEHIRWAQILYKRFKDSL